MLIHELLNKEPDIFTEAVPLIILNIKSDVCMDKNGKDTNHTSHIYNRVNFVINGEKYILHNIDWCEGGLQSEEIVTKNV